MIMCKQNQKLTINVPSGTVKGGIAMEVLRGVVIAPKFWPCREWGNSKQPPLLHSSRSLKHTICDPFEDRQIVDLVGVVPLVVAAPIVAVDYAAGP